MSAIQLCSRPCAPLHRTYILRPISLFQMVPHNEATTWITNRFKIRRGITIHLATDEKNVLSFPHHKEALRALDTANAKKSLNIHGCPYQFTVGDEIAHTRSIILDQRVHMTLRELPLHMWTPTIVEQILSPFCSLEYISFETRIMQDTSGFTCIVRADRLVHIPDKITVMVPKGHIPINFPTHPTTMPLLLNKLSYLLTNTNISMVSQKTMSTTVHQ